MTSYPRLYPMCVCWRSAVSPSFTISRATADRRSQLKPIRWRVFFPKYYHFDEKEWKKRGENPIPKQVIVVLITDYTHVFVYFVFRSSIDGTSWIGLARAYTNQWTKWYILRGDIHYWFLLVFVVFFSFSFHLHMEICCVRGQSSRSVLHAIDICKVNVCVSNYNRIMSSGDGRGKEEQPIISVRFVCCTICLVVY